MRVILPFTCQASLDLVRRLRHGANDEFLTYGPPGAADLTAGPGWCAFADIAAQTPGGWRPDVFLVWQMEYNTVPHDIADADCLTVGVIGDWNLGAQTVQWVGGAFDVLIADDPGVPVLRRLGLPNVHPAPIWSHDPALHRVIPGVERDIDLLMIGNLHQDIHRIRSQWIARVARLSRRYRVRIDTNIRGEDYVRLMNRARIVFNHSVRGEVNMRAYEAAACGALLFQEADNPSIRGAFRDREECVLYTDENFESLVEHYLTHEEERTRIAEAGRSVASRHSQAHALACILQIVEAERRSSRPEARPIRSLPAVDRRLRFAMHGAATVFPSDLTPALAQANAAAASAPHRADVANARGCILAELAMKQDAGPRRHRLLHEAADAMETAISIEPAHASARVNLAHVRIAQHDPERAVRALGQALAVLQGSDLTPIGLLGPYFPRTYDVYTVELERAWVTNRALSDEWTDQMRAILAWRCWEVLSDLAHENGNLVESAQFAAEAVALQPSFPMTRYRLATALRSMGRLADAEREYRRCLVDGPLSPPVWQELADVLLQQGKLADCVGFVADTLAIIDGCPPFECARAPLEETARRARRRLLDPRADEAA